MISRSCLLPLLSIGFLSCGHQPPVTPKNVASAPASVPASKPASLPEPQPPIADKRPFIVESPHGNREDPYYWLRDDTRKSADVLAYIKAENSYAQALTRRHRDVEEELYKEMIARLKQDDATVPYFDNGYWYYSRYDEGKQYPVLARKKGSLESPEEVLLDQNELAAGKSFFSVGKWAVSPDGSKLAYAVDTIGRRQFRLHIKDLASGQLLPDTASNLAASLAWANDSRTLFFVERDPTTLRGCKARRHRLGSMRTPALVYEEKDTSYYMSVRRAKSGRYVMIDLDSTVATETRLIRADRPTSKPSIFYPRERDHLYMIEHVGGRYVIGTNWKAKNFRVMQATERTKRRRSRWRELVPHQENAFISRVSAYNDFFAIAERSGGLERVKVFPRRAKPYYIEASEPTFTMRPVDLPDPRVKTLRYRYFSLTTPDSTYEISVATKNKELLKRQPVLGDFDSTNYASEFRFAPADDGIEIPVSLVYKKGTPLDGSAPLLQIAYGSYGSSYPVYFQSSNLSILNRGFVLAIAHVRGGQEMGRSWYDDGKLLKKKNTFTDFIDVTEYLIEKGYAARDKVFARGGSAGGLLMGAIVNMRPDLYRGVIAHVPFVDVVTTMLDESIPLTTNEFNEWGNPKKAEFYDYLLSYSPYDNIADQDYPSLLVTSGLWDSQVQYFEPTKWVAKLRAIKTDRNPLLLVTNIEAGHGGKSGRLRRYRERARDVAFLLMVLKQQDAREGWPRPADQG